MKRMLLSFLAGLAAGAGAYWYVDHHQLEAWQAKQSMMDHVEAAVHSVEAKWGEITAQTVREQLERTGVYVVEKAKAAGAAVADAATDARITSSIKTKLLSESALQAIAINVDTSAGVVTLSGKVRTHEQAAKAIQLAAATDGVRRIVSTIQVKETGESTPRVE